MAAASAGLASEASLSSPGLSSRSLRLGLPRYEGAGYVLTVRETGEHFCEACKKKFYIRRTNKREKTGRDRTKANTLAANAKSYAELLRAKILKQNGLLTFRTKWPKLDASSNDLIQSRSGKGVYREKK